MLTIKDLPIDPVTLRMLFNTIRSSFTRSSLYENAISKYVSKQKGPKGGARYVCENCKKDMFVKKDIEMDHHPEPVVPLTKRWHEMTVQEYYNRVFGLPVRSLCKPCHKRHSKEQRKMRTNNTKSPSTTAKEKKKRVVKKKSKGK